MSTAKQRVARPSRRTCSHIAAYDTPLCVPSSTSTSGRAADTTQCANGTWPCQALSVSSSVGRSNTGSSAGVARAATIAGWEGRVWSIAAFSEAGKARALPWTRQGQRPWTGI